MNDLRTKVTDLPLLEDKEQVDTVLALGKDGKMYRVDGGNIGGGSNLTPIKCLGEGHLSHCKLNIIDTNLIDSLLEIGGTIHVLVKDVGVSYKDIELNLVKKISPEVSPQSLSTFSYKPDAQETVLDDSLIGISLTQLDLDCVLVLELCDGSKNESPSALEASYKYFLNLYMIKISDVQGALEELSKETVNKNSKYLQNYYSPKDLVYGHFITKTTNIYNILNVFIEDKSVLSKPCLIEMMEE